MERREIIPQRSNQMIEGPAITRTGPTPEDWDEVRDVVTKLYITEGMTIGRLIPYMEDLYHFKASEKAYRYHFRQWGIRKNMSADRAISHLRQRPHAPEKGQVQEYLKRLPRSQRDQVLSSISGVTSSLQPPDELEQPEHLLHQLQDYVRHSSHGSLWPRDPGSGFKKEDDIPAWCSSLMLARMLHAEGKGAEADKLSALFLAQTPAHLSRQDPLVFSFVYSSVLSFGTNQPRVAEFLLDRFAAQSKAIRLNGSPLAITALLDLLRRMGPSSIVSQASRILPAYINMIQDELGAPFPLVQDMASDTMGRLSTLKLASCEFVMDLGRKLLQQVNNNQHHQSKYCLSLMVELANSYFVDGRYQEARVMMEKVLSEEYAHYLDERMLPGYHIRMRKINEAQGRLDEARESCLRALTTSIKVYGSHSDWALTTLVAYQKYLERVGDYEEAAKVAQDRDKVMQSLCDRAET